MNATVASHGLRSAGLLVLLLASAFLVGCATIDFERPKATSEAIPPSTDTSLGRAVQAWADQHQGQSAFYPLSQGMDALGARLRLAEIAEQSIDLQYFLMKDDTAGLVMLNALLKAADRGVRIRFLLDDIFTTSADRTLLLLNQHPNIEVRLFNPVSRRGLSSGLNFVGDFSRANRRMHNKSFTVDNQISIVGGRNIADEYYQLKDGSVFVDFDILAMGPIAREISASFDEYWNHSRAVPMEQVNHRQPDEDLETVRARIAEEFDGMYDRVYGQALESQLLQDLMSDRKPLVPAYARVLSDSPDKLINDIGEEHMQLATDLLDVLYSAKQEIIFITPYYIPGPGGVARMQELVNERGLRVIVLTNSLASNNHVPVHGAYTRYRKDVIRAGVELYEARANAAGEFKGAEEGVEAMTLHTKAILIDNRYLFVGSLNLDPRSIEINAEMGLLIDSPEIVRGFTDNADEKLANIAWRVLLNDDGDLEWHGRIDGEDVVETREPLASPWLRFKAWFMKVAPEQQL